VKQVLLASILILTPTVAHAQDLSAPSTPHVADPEAYPPPEQQLPAAAPCEVCSPALPVGQKHEGFYLRLQIGVGYMTARHGTSTMTGTGIGVGGAIGGMVIPNLALFGTFLYHQVRSPTTDFYGSTGTYSGNLTSETFGGGLAYYLEPSNVYFSAAAVATSAGLYDMGNNKMWTSNRGLGFDLMIGKEWWVGRDWGLGFAAEVTGAWMTDTDNHPSTWATFTYGMLFSATYN
jgi:hypothetical protein